MSENTAPATLTTAPMTNSAEKDPSVLAPFAATATLVSTAVAIGAPSA